MAEVFISYSSKDRSAARVFAEALALEGFTCWYDQRIQGAEVWDETIDREIRAAGVVVTLWTPAAVASRWVRSEADYAFQNNKLLPVIVASCELPLAYRLIQAFDLQGPPGQLRQHPRWRDFVARLREFLAINTVATLAERERAEKERQRRARRARFWRGAAFAGAGLVLAIALSAAAVWWQNERASAVGVDVTADGAALSLSNLRARRVGVVHFTDPERGEGSAVWAPLLAIAPQAEALLVEFEGGVTGFNRENGVWDWENPVRMQGWTCAAETQTEIPDCAFSDLYAFGERRISSSPFTRGIQTVGRLVAALTRGDELRVWSLPGGHAVRFGDPLGNCPASERPPVACNVAAFAPDPFESSFLVGLADGSVYDLGISTRPGATVLEPETSERVARLIARRPGHTPVGFAFGERAAAAISWDDGQIDFYYGVEELEPVSTPADNCGRARLGMSSDAMNIVAMCSPPNAEPELRRFTRTGWQQPWRVTHTERRNGFSLENVGDDVLVTSEGRFVIERAPFDQGTLEIYDTESDRLIDLQDSGGWRLARLRGREVLVGFMHRYTSSTMPDSIAVVEVDGARVLATSRIPSVFGGAIGFDERDVFAAYADHDSGDVVLWRITDPGGPLVQVPTATR